MRETRIILDHIGKYFGDRPLFTNLCAEISGGQCVAITGHNGSGKSTLLKIVAGLLRPSAGQVRFFGPDPNRQLTASERLACTGMAAPDMAMYTALTGVENILFWAKVRGSGCTPAQARECCRRVGLYQAADQQVQSYSTGMRQRLKLAVLVALRPSVWLLDEPSSNLDAQGRAMVGELIVKAVDGGAAVLIATNEAEESGYACAQIAL